MDDAKHFTLHRTALITRNYPTHSVSGVGVEKLCSRATGTALTLRKYSVSQYCFHFGLLDLSKATLIKKKNFLFFLLSQLLLNHEM